MTIRKSIRIERPPEISFRLFCEKIGDWWPGGYLGSESKVFLECEVGGRFYERGADGTEYEVGRVTAYQPPSMVAFSWRAPSWKFVTQVEIRFSAEAGGTRVELEHRGWEQSEEARAGRGSYDSGWDTMLGHYREFASAYAARDDAKGEGR